MKGGSVQRGSRDFDSVISQIHPDQEISLRARVGGGLPSGEGSHKGRGQGVRGPSHRSFQRGNFPIGNLKGLQGIRLVCRGIDPSQGSWFVFPPHQPERRSRRPPSRSLFKNRDHGPVIGGKIIFSDPIVLPRVAGGFQVQLEETVKRLGDRTLGAGAGNEIQQVVAEKVFLNGIDLQGIPGSRSMQFILYIHIDKRVDPRDQRIIHPRSRFGEGDLVLKVFKRSRVGEGR